MKTKELRKKIASLAQAIEAVPHSAQVVKAKRELQECWAQVCEIEGHEYAMIYNDGTTCMNCGHHRGLGEESGIIRSVSGVVVPALLCDLARALPMPVCPPEHTRREAMTYCKDCDESRDELQQMVGDGNLNAIAVVVGVYLRRLYAEHEQVCNLVEALREQAFVPVDFDLYKSIKEGLYETTGVLEMIFGEVLSDEARDVPTDEEAVRMVKEMIGGEQ